jgi:SAM-dependent methyltransferase
VDVGSAAEFVGCLSKVIDVTMVDIRPLSVSLDTLKFKEGSILALPFDDASVSSLSSICVIEHIGLGRYGDPIDPDGSESAIKEIKRVVKPGGHVYISVPTAAENMVEFNANRRFTEEYILEQFAPLELVESRYIYGNEFVDKWRPEYGTGCYYFRA